jgi:murein tripeptide amidase MpaA
MLAPLALSIVLACAAQTPSPFHHQAVVRVHPRSTADLARVLALADGLWSCTPGREGVDIRLSRDKFAALDALGLPWGELIEDVGTLLEQHAAEVQARRARDGLGWFENFKTLEEFRLFFDGLHASRPDLVSPVFVAGPSIQGRDIWGVRLTGPDTPGNPRSERPQVMLNGGQHAREWANHMTVAYLAHQLVNRYDADPAVRRLVDAVEFVIVPIVNPDGYAYTWASANNRLWRKNRRNNGDGTFGVDLNRNWGYEWGGVGASTSTSSETYRGTAPFSEPETQAVRDLIRDLPRLRAHIDFHTYTQLVLSPWGYTDQLPPQAELFDSLNLALQNAIYAHQQVPYRAGPSYTTIYPASGVMPDWVFGERGAFSWTIELRDRGQYGFVLPPEFILPTAIENFPVVFVLGEFALTGLAVAPVDTPDLAQPFTPAPVRVRISAEAGTSILAATLHVRATRTPGFGDFTSIPMTPAGPDAFEASLPPEACGTILEYSIHAQSVSGAVTRFPHDGSLLTARVLAHARTFNDDMEIDRGWTRGAPGDDATAGLWARCQPSMTGAQPGEDVTPDPGVLAWITDCRGGQIGSGDVDNGRTTLTSPRFSAVDPALPDAAATLTYWRWYSNNRGSNPNTNSMPVLLSNDDGNTWTQLELVTENQNRWVRRVVDLASAGVTPTDRMRLRFVARDLTGAIVEAGVDEVSLLLTACPCPADLTGDGTADFNDLLEFLNLFKTQDPRADFAPDAVIDFNDFLAFLNTYAQPCP